MERVSNAILERQYEKEREAEAQAEQECIKTIDIINKKIDILQKNTLLCREQIRIANKNITMLLNHQTNQNKYSGKVTLILLMGMLGVGGVILMAVAQDL